MQLIEFYMMIKVGVSELKKWHMIEYLNNIICMLQKKILQYLQLFFKM